MALDLCPNCRLPVQSSLAQCPKCGVQRRSAKATQRVVSTTAAVVALAAAAVALVSRRLAT